MLPLTAYTGQVIMLEVPVGVEVKTDQDSDDLRIRHHTFSAASGRTGRGRNSLFCHFFFKFLAKIIGNTKNFCNFTFGNHDIVVIV